MSWSYYLIVYLLVVLFYNYKVGNKQAENWAIDIIINLVSSYTYVYMLSYRYGSHNIITAPTTI